MIKCNLKRNFFQRLHVTYFIEDDIFHLKKNKKKLKYFRDNYLILRLC